MINRVIASHAADDPSGSMWDQREEIFSPLFSHEAQVMPTSSSFLRTKFFEGKLGVGHALILGLQENSCNKSCEHANGIAVH